MRRSGPSWADVGASLAAVERWLLPGGCLLCGGPVESRADDPLVCALCRARWSRLPAPQCPRCGQPETPGLACRLCAPWPVELRGVRSAVWLDAPARRAVHLLKYEGWRRLALVMAETMAPLVPRIPGIALVPIPLGAARARSRGYNQAAALARALGRLLNLPVAEQLLRRARETATQTTLTPEGRQANLAGAFAAAGSPPRPVLVDDVFTTGATLAEAARALVAAGAAEVGGVTFARAERPLAAAERTT